MFFRVSMQRFVSKSLALSNSKSITSNHRQFHNGVEKTSVILVHFEKPLSPAYLCCSFTHFCNLMKNCCEVFFTPSLKRAPFEFPSASQSYLLMEKVESIVGSHNQSHPIIISFWWLFKCAWVNYARVRFDLSNSKSMRGKPFHFLLLNPK